MKTCAGCAELAELRDERDELQSCFDSQQELIATLYSEQQDLISGLEALAVRMDRLARMDRTDGDECAAARVETFAEELRALIPAAANTESEEVKS